MDYDQTNIATMYDAGRGYAPATLALWLKVIAPWLPRTAGAAILDLGCGTGRYSEILAEHFGAQVVAVDPSEKMLAEARRKATGRVRYERAFGESLPLENKSIDVVFMSMVFHHFRDRHRVVRECRRILKPRGTVCLRAATFDEIDAYPYVPFFVRSGALLRQTLQSRETIRSIFAAQGFTCAHYELVPSEVAPTWGAFAEKTAHRADSILVRLTDREFQEGMVLLRKHAATCPKDDPVIEPIDFFVFTHS
jgi:ubiquinone/menaquinone biosynthesis C-methylase UbiE